MKKSFILNSLLIMVAACFIFLLPISAHAELTHSVTLPIEGTYDQSEARKLTNLVNNFRTGSEAWYYDTDSTTKVYCNNLGQVTWDNDLEKIAKQRAAECAVLFSHSRPNGTEYKTAYSESGYNAATAWGENLHRAATDAESAMIVWKEEYSNYDNQEHRRVMLDSHFTRFAAAYFFYDHHPYWVMEFSDGSGNTSYVAPEDGIKTVNVELAPNCYIISHANSNYGNYSINTQTLTMHVNDTFNVSDIYEEITTTAASNSSYPSGGLVISNEGNTFFYPNRGLTSLDSSIVEIRDGKLIAKKTGNTDVTMISSVTGETITFHVSITLTDISTGYIYIFNPYPAYTGSPIEPRMDVVYNNRHLVEGVDYVATYENNTNPGNATVKVTGIGSYSGDLRENFEIIANNIGEAVVRMKDDNWSFEYKGSPVKPEFKVTNWVSGQTLVEGVDYTVSYSNNTKPGTATLTLTGIGIYSGTLTHEFSIYSLDDDTTFEQATDEGKTEIIKKNTDKSVPVTKNVSVKPGKKSVTIKWKKQTKNTKGYIIQYSTNKKFKTNVKSVTVNKAKTASKTITKLKKGKTYYFRICSFNKKNNKTTYSKWSSVKKCKVK